MLSIYHDKCSSISHSLCSDPIDQHQTLHLKVSRAQFLFFYLIETLVMASWLKVAEDLFEVVDRRAKRVVGETDEQFGSLSTALNGQEFQVRREKSKEKGQLRLSTSELSKTSDTQRELSGIQPSASNAITDKGEAPQAENTQGVSNNFTAQASTELSSRDTANSNSVVSEIPFLETPPKDHAFHDSDEMEVSANGTIAEAPTFSINDNPIENLNGGAENSSYSLFNDFAVKTVNGDHPDDDGTKAKVVDEKELVKTKEEEPQSGGVEANGTNNVQEKDILQESFLKKKQDPKNDSSPTRVQDQLDEAQGLLKIAISTGQSKEARLARVCAGLSSRLQEYKSENAQLEELLTVERERSNSYKAHIKQLEQDLSASKIEVTRIESNMADALSSKNSEIEALVSSMDALKKQAALSEGKLASLQANTEAMMRSRELTETRMMQALREELASAERRAEEERAAHNATKMAAMEREVDLEQRAVGASTALARIQRTVDERTSRVSELEQKLSLLEVECASLTQELHEMEARARHRQKKSPEDSNQTLQVQAWQEEAERARQGQRDAESKLSFLEAETQKMRVEMAGMKRDAEHYSRQEHLELEKRYRELTDLLYYKQTQLEAMASDKAAAEYQLEKQAKSFQEAQVEAERSRAMRRASASTSWEEETDLKALEPLPLHHRHMAKASIQLQKAAKLLDSGAVHATRFLWRYPIARLIFLFYLVFVHLFMMYLLHRLQEQADNFLSSREEAASMGLVNPN